MSVYPGPAMLGVLNVRSDGNKGPRTINLLEEFMLFAVRLLSVHCVHYFSGDMRMYL